MDWIKNYLTNLFGMNEERISTIIAITFFFCLIGGYQIYKALDVSDNIRFIICTGMGLVAGVNIVQPAINNYINKQNNESENIKINNLQNSEVKL